MTWNLLTGRFARSLVTLSLAAAAVAFGAPAANAADSPANGGMSLGAPKGSLTQDPTWVAAKAAGRVVKSKSGSVSILAAGMSPAAVPASAYLDTSVTSRIIEPEGRNYDDHHQPSGGITDQNYWRLCGPGAVTVALWYWPTQSDVTGWVGTFTEPYGPERYTTYWAGSDTGGSGDTSDGYSSVGRGYIMNVAMVQQPPDYSTPGLDTFTTYPQGGAIISDARDMLNWQASDHDQTHWSTWFYATVPNKTESLTAAHLLSNVETDIATDGVPVVVALNTYLNSSTHLPNWSVSLGHSVTIVGYNNSNGTYRYTDTCGVHCEGGTNGGTHDVSQSVMFALIASWGTGYDW
jgi:hypothetical protein